MFLPVVVSFLDDDGCANRQVVGHPRDVVVADPHAAMAGLATQRRRLVRAVGGDLAVAEESRGGALPLGAGRRLPDRPVALLLVPRDRGAAPGGGGGGALLPRLLCLGGGRANRLGRAAPRFAAARRAAASRPEDQA